MLTSMKIRCPDKPIRTSQDTLKQFQDNDYIATYKYDGWRCIIDWDGSDVGFYSRRDVNQGGPTEHQVSPMIKEQCISFLKENDLPKGTRLDAEWICKRTSGPEELRIIGIQYLNGEWLGKDSEDLRWTIIKSLDYNQPSVQLAEYAENNYEKFFNQIKSKNIDLSEGKQKVEGIVLKHKSGTLKGNVKKGVKNPSWFKIKWRDGASGYSPTF